MTDKILSPHFSLYVLTHTDHAKFQEHNRNVTLEQISKLAVLANLGEQVFQILGGCQITSGYRCKALNDAVGSTDKSQHLKCEAIDLLPFGPITDATVKVAFNRLVFEVSKGNLKMGQLIWETQKGRDGGSDTWIHLSLGEPYRPTEKCCQILYMKDGVYKQVAKA